MPCRAWRAAFAGLVATVACNEGLQPTPACPRGFVGICGTVSFQGTLPDSTDKIYIVAYDTFPRDSNDLFKFKPLPPPTLPLGGPPFFYTLPLPNGRYEWVLAVWKKVGTLSAQSADSLLREAGFYRDAGDTTSHGSGIVIVNGAAAESIDFVVDFGNMHRICTYFPPCPP
jgi:hypothetical protein